MTPERCVTCSDEALVARVVALAGANAVVVDDEGREERVALDLIGAEVAVGERLLCHAGLALARVEEVA